MTLHSVRSRYDSCNNLCMSETLYAYRVIDSREPDSYPFLNLDIPGIKEEIISGASIPNTTLIMDDTYRVKIWVLKALSVPKETIRTIKGSIYHGNTISKELSSSPEVSSQFNKICNELISFLQGDLTIEGARGSLAQIFEEGLKNDLFKQVFISDLFVRETIRLIELAVFIRDIDLFCFLLDQGASFDARYWGIGSLFGRDTVQISDKNIEILEEMLLRGYSLEELLAGRYENIERMYCLALLTKDQKLISFLDKHGYAYLSHKASADVLKIAGIQKV